MRWLRKEERLEDSKPKVALVELNPTEIGIILYTLKQTQPMEKNLELHQFLLYNKLQRMLNLIT